MVGDDRCEHADIFTDPVIFLVWMGVKDICCWIEVFRLSGQSFGINREKSLSQCSLFNWMQWSVWYDVLPLTNKRCKRKHLSERLLSHHPEKLESQLLFIFLAEKELGAFVDKKLPMSQQRTRVANKSNSSLDFIGKCVAGGQERGSFPSIQYWWD